MFPWAKFIVYRSVMMSMDFSIFEKAFRNSIRFVQVEESPSVEKCGVDRSSKSKNLSSRRFRKCLFFGVKFYKISHRCQRENCM